MPPVTAPMRLSQGGQPRNAWIGGLADWKIGDTACLSVAFTWKLPEARARALWYRALGYRVIAGGPATFVLPKYLADVAEIKPHWPDAVRHHNPAATFATKGCNERCHFCIVWRMEGAFRYFPEFQVRPVLCDNNLSAIDPKYQDFIIERYQAADVPLLDANSGFEPKSFDGAVLARWQRINRGPWRFGYDETKERETVRRVMAMLKAARVPAKKIRPYVLIGNEPFEACMGRIREVIEWGGEPHVQPFTKLTSLEKKPHVSKKYGWTARQLIDVARWANRRIWRYAPFEEYDRSARSYGADRCEQQPELFA
jgi:hypothetical protein